MSVAAKSVTRTSYTDDTKVAFAVKDQFGTIHLQKDLDAISKWAK